MPEYIKDLYFDLHVDESTYHGKRAVDSLKNRIGFSLEPIKVQVSNCLCKDDIMRLTNKRSRSKLLARI